MFDSFYRLCKKLLLNVDNIKCFSLLCAFFIVKKTELYLKYFCISAANRLYDIYLCMNNKTSGT